MRSGSYAVLVDVTDPVFPRALRLVAQSFSSTAPGYSQVIVARRCSRARGRSTGSAHSYRLELVGAEPGLLRSLGGGGRSPSFAKIGQNLAWLPAKPAATSSRPCGGRWRCPVHRRQTTSSATSTSARTRRRSCRPRADHDADPGRATTRRSAARAAATRRCTCATAVHAIARTLNSSGDVVRISPSCMSTEPKPVLSISGGSAGATCSGAETRGSRGRVHHHERVRRRVDRRGTVRHIPRPVGTHASYP